MTGIELLDVTLVAIGAAIAMVLITVGVSSLVRAHRVRMEPLLADARRATIAALAGDQTEIDDAFTSLNRIPQRYVSIVMLDLAPSVTGASRAVLVVLAERVGLLARARRGVRHWSWPSRLYSARVLTAFGVESEALCTLLTDRSPEVRAQAAAWCAATPSVPAIEGVIGLLGDSDGLCRFAAQDALIRIGLQSSDALLGALDGASEEVTGRILEIAAAMGDTRFLGVAIGLSSDPLPRTRALACAVLARSGDPSAGSVLVDLLQDPSEDVVLAAAAGLARLSYWPGAAELEPLLHNESWELRKQASLSLLALGAPGTIMLQVTAPGEGPAAEMAGQALQLRSITSQSEVA